MRCPYWGSTSRIILLYDGCLEQDYRTLEVLYSFYLESGFNLARSALRARITRSGFISSMVASVEKCTTETESHWRNLKACIVFACDIQSTCRKGGSSARPVPSQVHKTCRSREPSFRLILPLDIVPSMSLRWLLKNIRIRLPCLPRGQGPTTTSQPDRKNEKLAILVQVLKIAEKAAEASGVPYLKGAIAFAAEVAECVQGYRSSNEELNRLALKCGNLVVDITKALDGSRNLSKNMETLVEDLFGTLEKVQITAKDIIDESRRVRRLLAQKDTNDKLRMLYGDIVDAQMRFLTLVPIANAKDQSQLAQDDIYNHGSVVLGDFYASGKDWIAFNAKVFNNEGTVGVIVKRYKHEDVSKRKAMHETDIKAFKRDWHPNLPQYMGRSHPGVEEPYSVLRGVTSDHVSDYIALKFAEDNLRGSIEALKLLKDLTNALSFTVVNTDSCSFDISKVHLNDEGNLMIVNLEPSLATNKGSKNDMPYWRSWQEICIELLAGDPTYEPDPSVEYDADPLLHKRLEYLRPILGHIHYGGVRFKETSIEMAFKSEGMLLAQVLRKLRADLRKPLALQVSADAQVLHAMSRRSRELHYVAHFRDPLEIDVGDIGYIIGKPPRFIPIENVRSELADGWEFGPRKVQPFRFFPADRWTTTTVEGITRYTFQFTKSSATDLADWRKERPRLDKNFLLRRINLPTEHGLVVECSKAWKVLSERAESLASNHTERSINASNLILVVYFKQQSGYATFRLNKNVNSDQWREIWTTEGFASPPNQIYFYESPPGGPNGVWGYFSFSAAPGSPYLKWTPERDNAGEPWGWTFHSEDWTVEISKPNIKQYIRYVQL
ncbi:hypothetical protein C8R43DRAFT_1002045 [Mycena crocata]|nr:hypothetical protein C8R43DRAFT_1002045 [Mycena crocata]